MKSILLRLNDGEIDIILDLLENRSYLLSSKIEDFKEEKREPKAEDIQEYQLINDIQDKIGLSIHTIYTDADIINKKGENYLDSLEVSSIRLNNVYYQTTGTGGGCTALTTKVGKVILMITDDAMIPDSIESEVSIGVYDGDELIEISENLDNGKDTVEYRKLQNILAWDGTTIKFKYITEEYLNKIIDNPDSILFRVEWIEGYDNTDPKIVSIDELNSDDWDMTNYHGDSWISEFARLKVGSCIDSYGDGHVKFTRID